MNKSKNILNKLQYDRELKELQIKEIDELMKEYQRQIGRASCRERV